MKTKIFNFVGKCYMYKSISHNRIDKICQKL